MKHRRKQHMKEAANRRESDVRIRGRDFRDLGGSGDGRDGTGALPAVGEGEGFSSHHPKTGNCGRRRVPTVLERLLKLEKPGLNLHISVFGAPILRGVSRALPALS